DAPVRIVKLAQEAGEDMNRLWKSLRPGRCLEHGLRHLLSGIGETDRYGRISKKLLTFGRAEKEPPTGVSVKRGIAEITRSLNETSLRRESKKLKQKRISASEKIGETRAELEGPEDWDSEEEVDVKATKSDDAKVDFSKWNKEVIHTLRSSELPTVHPALTIVTRWMEDRALNSFRDWMLKWYKRKTTKGYFDWKRGGPAKNPKEGSVRWDVHTGENGESVLKHQRYIWTENGRTLYEAWWRQNYEEDQKEAEAAWDALSRLADTTWWEWKDGSRCLHWKWPRFYQSTIRDGLKGRFKYTPKAWTQPQRSGQNPKAHGLMKIKLQLVRAKRYITKGFVKSLTSFFGVDKGLFDIRMVYDGTKSGLNDSLWVPGFPLPTVDTMLRAVTYDTVMSDFDIGDCFLNFVLHETLQSLCGVDLTKYFGEGDILWERW
ncbi:unnamed protein product, partial [Cylindrotheca closterium]